MSKLTHPIIEGIKSILSNPIEISDIEIDQDFLTKVEVMAKNIYARDQSSRTLSQIEANCFLGKYGEHAICSRLIKSGLNVIWNDEDVSLQYSWDVQVEGLKLELKYQKFDNRWLSFSSERKYAKAIESWRSYDLVLAWREKEGSVYPWILADSEVMSIDRGLFVPSNFSGRYLRMEQAQAAGLLVYLVK